MVIILNNNEKINNKEIMATTEKWDSYYVHAVGAARKKKLKLFSMIYVSNFTPTQNNFNAVFSNEKSKFSLII